MSDQTIDSPMEAGGKPVMVGNRGGLKTKDGLSSAKPVDGQTSTPLYTLQGPGYDIAFFKDKGGFRIKYKGPNAESIINDVKKEVNKGTPIKKAIDMVKTGDYE